MKATELMTGDWVRISLSKTNLDSHKGKVAKVTELKSYPNWNSIKVTTGGLDEYYCERDDEIDPIPLTAEILEKNSIILSYNKMIHGSCFKEDEYYRLEISQEERDGIFWSINCDEYHVLKLNYVHELQHALRLCGIEKEIVI